MQAEAMPGGGVTVLEVAACTAEAGQEAQAGRSRSQQSVSGQSVLVINSNVLSQLGF